MNTFLMCTFNVLSHIDKKVMDFTVAEVKCNESKRRLYNNTKECEELYNKVMHEHAKFGPDENSKLQKLTINRINNINNHLLNLNLAENRTYLYENCLARKICRRDTSSVLSSISNLRDSYHDLLEKNFAILTRLNHLSETKDKRG